MRTFYRVGWKFRHYKARGVRSRVCGHAYTAKATIRAHTAVQLAGLMSYNPKMITSIGQIAVPVGDLPRAVKFYRDVLGLNFVFEVSGMAFFNCGGVRLMLNARDESQSPHGSIIYYKTDDIQATAADLKSHDVKFEAQPHLVAKMPDHDLWMAFIRDSEDNLVALMSEVRQA